MQSLRKTFNLKRLLFTFFLTFLLLSPISTVGAASITNSENINSTTTITVVEETIIDVMSLEEGVNYTWADVSIDPMPGTGGIPSLNFGYGWSD